MSAKVSAAKVCPGCSSRYPPDAQFCPNDGTPLSSTPITADMPALGPETSGEAIDPYVGCVISEHIEIRRLAGVGAMGRVYRAFQRGIDRDVAVKILHRELSSNQQLVARFHREAKVASRLQHPNVVQVHLAGQLPDGAMFIVMEYLDGVSLQGALAASGRVFPLERTLHIVLQICDAVGEAHAQGVVHRDIKPENVMLVRRGSDPDFVKVLDFGIARLNWGQQSMATAAGLIFGTARYISPEGAQGQTVGPQGDVYATATLLYQMLAGCTPFEGDQAVALLVQHIHDAPPPLRSMDAASPVPEPIAAVVMQNLAKSPEARAPDARAFGQALVEAAALAGLSPEDLVPHSHLFVPQARRSIPSPSVRSPAEGAPTPSPQHATPPPVAAGPPGASTRKWGDAQLPAREAAQPPTPPPSAPTSPQNAKLTPPPPGGAPANDAPRPPAVTQAMPEPRPVRTEPALISPLTQHLTAPTPPSPAVYPRRGPPGHVGPAGASTAGASAGNDRPPESSRRQAPKPERRGARFVGVVLLCFLAGTVAVGLGSYELGWFGVGSSSGSLDDAVRRAEAALKQERWDTPPGDSVRDITTAALARWPGNPRLLDLLARSTDELVKDAVGRKLAGDLPGALHLAHLAAEFTPKDSTARRLVAEYERAAQETADASAPPLPSSSPPVVIRHGAGGHPPQVQAASPRATLDATPPHPKVGQPVSFTARVAGASGAPKTVEDQRFLINGPSLPADSRLAAVPEPGSVYVATFAGFEPGKYEVLFDAKVDGAAVHASRTVLIEGAPPAPPASASAASSNSRPSTPPVPSGKWL